MAKEYLKIWFSDIETAHEFFEGNDKHLGEFMVNVYRSYAELPTSFRCKQVEKYFKTYSKQIEFIKVSKANGLKAHLQDTENQQDESQTPEGGVQGAVQPPPQPSPQATPKAKDKREKVKGKEEKVNNKKENSKEKDFIVPTFEEFFAYCEEKGFDHVAKRAFDYYSANDWKDNQNNPVKNWKLKLQSVWFDEQRNPKPIAKTQQEPQEEKDDVDEYFYFRWIGLGNENWNFYKIKRSIMNRYFENEKEGGCIPECLDHLSFQRRKSANLCTPNFK